MMPTTYTDLVAYSGICTTAIDHILPVGSGCLQKDSLGRRLEWWRLGAQL